MVRVAVAICAACLCVADVGAGRDAAGVRLAAVHTTVYRDAAGEDPKGPDITTVTVASQDGEVLTIRVDVPTLPVLTDDMRLRVWLDADNDPKTGLTVEGLEGIDHFLLVDRWELGPGAVGLFRCSATVCSGGRIETSPTTTLGFTYSNGGVFTLATSELGLPHLERLRFAAVMTSGVAYDPATRRYDLTTAHLDRAPDEGYWTFDTRPLRLTRLSATPATPRAGKAFVLRGTAIRTDTGATLRTGRVSCSTRIAGRAIPAQVHRFVGRQAVCSFDVPAAARGRGFRSTITVSRRNARIAGSLSGEVR